MPLHRPARVPPPRLLCLALLSTCAAPPRPAASSGAGDAPVAPAPEARAPEADPPAPLLEPASSEPAAQAKGPVDARTPQEIQRVITENRHAVRACYEAALETNPGIAGDLVVAFVIDPFGEVKSAEVTWAESQIHVPELDECATKAVGNWRFPASSRGLESRVSYPFNLNPPRDLPGTPEPGGAGKRQR
jgi:outer membrane biosynthesis protein TonB